MNSRLKSLPDRPVRYLPKTTPSGFAIGKILNTNFCRNSSFSLELLQSHWMKTYIIKEALHSSEWIRPITKIIFLFFTRIPFLNKICYSDTCDVIVRRGCLRPPKLRQRWCSERKSAGGCKHAMKFISLVYEYGGQYAI
jgi:hypothetical protein